MKTKSAEQIRKQGLHLMDVLACNSWNGKEYENHSDLVQRLEKIANICDRYVYNIYKYFGVDGVTCGANVANELYIRRVSLSVYTGKEETE